MDELTSSTRPSVFIAVALALVSCVTFETYRPCRPEANAHGDNGGERSTGYEEVFDAWAKARLPDQAVR